MKSIRNLVVSICLLSFLFSSSFAQYYETSQQSGIGIPYFDVVLHNQFDENLEGNLVVVMTQFTYDDLTFVKSDSSGYDAEFELLIAAYDKKENVVVSRTINKNVNVKDYTFTNSRDKKMSMKNSINLDTGEYTLLVRATDLTTNKIASRKMSLKLPNYQEKEISISGISFLQKVEFDSVMQIVDFTPTIGNNFTARAGSFYIYFDLFTQELGDPVEIQYTFSNKKGKVELDTIIVKEIDKPVSSHIYKVEKDDYSENRYRLEVSTKQGKYKAKAEQNFSFFWTEVPGTDEDIDLALEQMTYIIPNDSLKKYKKSTFKKKQAFFKRFWERRDPNPKTAKNELKDEYFQRINYANRKFSAFSQDGWVTDRGRILIKFGFPDDIERHPFEMGTPPYEIWRFYALRKTFLFEDRTGFGDYRLHPAYLDVEFQ